MSVIPRICCNGMKDHYWRILHDDEDRFHIIDDGDDDGRGAIVAKNIKVCPWCGANLNDELIPDLRNIALDEASEIIKILHEDKDTNVSKVIYTGERIANWWKNWGIGSLNLPVRKDYPHD